MIKASLFAACLIAAGVLAAPAYAQSVGEKTGVNSALGITPSTPDFVKQAAMSDMFEIQSSQLAEQKSDDAPTKSFAQKMVTDHTKTSSEVKSMVSSGKLKGVELPTDMSSSQKSMLDKLKGLNGKDFTKQYHSDQVSAHKDAVSLFQRYGKGGDNDQIKNWASKTVPALEHHLQMAQDLDKKK
jgi:putative membrane protein